jgi:hypothetical protein
MNHPTHHASPEQAGLPALVAGFVIDYFRWLALVPMVFAWAFLVLCVVLIVAINFQGDIDRALQQAEPTIERWLGPAESVETAEDGETETVTFTDTDFKSWIYRIWLVAALAGYLLGLVRSWLFGPWQPPSLKRKLGRVAIAAGICSGLLFCAWLLGSETFTGPVAGWIAMFLLGPLGVWLISAASLGISHLLDRIRAIAMSLADRAGLAVIHQLRRPEGRTGES